VEGLLVKRKLLAALVAAALFVPMLASAMPALAALAPVSPGLAKLLKTEPGGDRAGVFVNFAPGAEGWQRTLADKGVEVVKTYDRVGAAFVVATYATIKELRGLAGVTYIEDNAMLRAAGETSVWATRARGANEAVYDGPFRDASEKVLDGSGVGVAIIDSGIDSPHPDLVRRIVKNYKVECTFVLVHTGTDRCYPGPVEMDEGVPSDTSSGHGTHVSGIVAGDGTASRGTFRGVAPGAGLYAFGSGEGINVLFAVESYEYILDYQHTFSPAIRVINNSWGNAAGTAYNPNGVIEKLVKEAAQAGIISVFAAGNDGTNADTGNQDDTSGYSKDPTPGVISVANYNDAGTGSRDNTLSSSSSRARKASGPATYPDISAPGSSITSTCNPRLPLCQAGAGSGWPEHYAFMSGTSMAAPHITGVIALILQAHPGLTPAQVEDVLQDTAHKFTGLAGAPGAYEPDPQNPGGTISYDKGAGIVDVPEALKALGTPHDGQGRPADVTITSPASGSEVEGSSVTVGGTARDGTPPSALTDAVLATDPAGDRQGPKGADLLGISVKETSTAMEYTWKVADVEDSVAGVELRFTQRVAGVARVTSVVIEPTGPSTLPASSTITAPAASVRWDTAADTVTAVVPFANLGNPPAGTVAHNAWAGSYVAAIDDVAPGGSAADFATKPEFAKAYRFVRVAPGATPSAAVTVRIDNGAPVPATLTGVSPYYDWTADLSLAGLAPGNHVVTADLTVDGVARDTSTSLLVIPAPIVYSAAITAPAAGATIVRGPAVISGTTSESEPVPGTKAVTIQVTAPGYDSGQQPATGTSSWTADFDFTPVSAATATITARYLVDGVVKATATRSVALVASASVTRTVDCGAATDDATAIQAAIDASATGDTVALSGRCDISTVAAHGGSIWSIERAAVVIDRAITLTSAGTPRSATIAGDGDQAAVLVAPAGDGAVVKALNFENVGRAVVVWNASNVTVGAAGAINNPQANRIVGGPTMNQAILALSNRYGADDVSGRAIVNVAGRGGNVTMPMAGQNLTGFKALGNYVYWTATGPNNPGVYDVIAIDVRQRTAGAKDVTIQNNAVGMGGTEFPSVNMNAVRVYSHALEPIDDVVVNTNNLGRNEDLPGQVADVHAAGRVGVLLHRVTDFQVNGNGVRVRLSPTGFPMPGGGIVVADSSRGEVRGNAVISLADPSTADSDLGAIGVIDQWENLFAGRTDELPTSDIEVTENIVGQADGASTGVGAQKGIVLNGVVRPLVHGNTVKFSTLDAVHIGTAINGPGDFGNPGLRTQQSPVKEGIVCRNFLDVDGSDPYSFDDTSEITVGQASGTAWPGGYSATNSSCFPTLSLNATGPIGPGQDLVATVAALPHRNLTVNLFDEDFGHAGATPNILKNVTVGGTGRATVTFTAAELQGQKDGLLTVTAFVEFDEINFQDTKQATLAAHPTPLPAGTVTIADGGDGYTSRAESLANIPVTWTKANDNRVTGVTVWFADAAGFIPAGCGPATSFGPTGAGYLNSTCANNLPEGPYTFNAQWRGSNGLESARVSVVSIMDRVAGTPVITSPAPGATIGSNTVSVSGTADPGDGIAVKAGSVTEQVTAAGDGSWTAQLTLADGGYSVTATATDSLGNTATSAPVAVKVITTSVAPDAPVVTAPSAGSYVMGSFSVTGTAAPGVTVRLAADGSPWRETVASGSGSWSVTGTLADGAHTLSVTAVDSLDRSSPAASVTFTVDGTDPEATVTTTDRVFLPGQAKFQGTATDNIKVDRVVVSLNNTATGTATNVTATCTGCETGSGTWEATFNVPAGAYSSSITAYDAAGNLVSFPGHSFVVSG
jgi:serine protease AprX